MGVERIKIVEGRPHRLAGAVEARVADHPHHLQMAAVDDQRPPDDLLRRQAQARGGRRIEHHIVAGVGTRIDICPDTVLQPISRQVAPGEQGKSIESPIAGADIDLVQEDDGRLARQPRDNQGLTIHERNIIRGRRRLDPRIAGQLLQQAVA